MLDDWRQKARNIFSNGAEGNTEVETRRLEDEALRRRRERRRLARLALAHTKDRMAEDKRAQASYQNETRIRKELLQEAARDEHDAKRLRAGEIGLLEAMGIPIEDPE